jgi:hypothetical protein
MFVRPYGLDQPATPRVVKAIEDEAAARHASRSLPMHLRALQMAMQGAVGVASAPRTIARGVGGDTGGAKATAGKPGSAKKSKKSVREQPSAAEGMR